MDTLGHSDAPAACIVMEGSDRAGGPVKKEMSRREGQAHRGREDPPRCPQLALTRQPTVYQTRAGERNFMCAQVPQPFNV